MSKIVCDVCGASYPETEVQCPICGTAKSDAAMPAGDTAAQADDYAYVKGGRFSKSNVKKHSSNQELPRVTAADKPEKEPKPVRQRPTGQRRERKQESSGKAINVALIIVVVIMVLAIVVVCAYIAMKYIDQLELGLPSSTTSTAPAGQTTVPGDTNTTGVEGPVSVPCIGLRLPILEYTFTQPGETLLLQPIKQPENTTEQLRFASADPRIATVDDNGKVTAVADGETVIYVLCGSYKAELKVTCNVGVTPPEPTQPSVPVPPVTTQPSLVLELNRSDFTLSGYGASWNLYNGPIDRDLIVWTSNDETVATVSDGKVVAVGNGRAVITAQYGEQIVTCVVHVNSVVKASFTLSTTDFTIKVGGSYTIQAYTSDGLRIDPSELKFTVSREGFFTVDENGKVTGVQSNYGYYLQYVYVEYNGETLQCVVRVNG